MKRIKVNILILLLTVGTIAISFSQNREGLVPEQCGLSAERLHLIDKMLDSCVRKNEVAGGVVLIARHGRVGYLHAFGMKDIETKEPMTTDVIFRIASMTKAITLVAAMMLMEKDIIQLDDPVSKFIPEFQEMQVLVQDTGSDSYHLEKARRQITLRHLLNHTSGLTYDFLGPEVISDLYTLNNIYSNLGPTTGTMAEMLQRLAKLPLVSHPGEKWQYGLGTDVLGHIIEIVSGRPLDEYMHDNIFEPIGMIDTYYYLPTEKLNRLAPLYGAGKNGDILKVRGTVKQGLENYSDYELASRNKNYVAGGGGLLSTAIDYYKFLQMLLNGGTYNGKRLLSEETIKLISSEQTGDMFNWWNGHGFGFGFAISRGTHPDDPSSRGTYGWLGYFNTHFWIDPQENLIGIVLTQMHPENSDVEINFKRLVYQAIVD